MQFLQRYYFIFLLLLLCQNTVCACQCCCHRCDIRHTALDASLSHITIIRTILVTLRCVDYQLYFTVGDHIIDIRASFTAFEYSFCLDASLLDQFFRVTGCQDSKSCFFKPFCDFHNLSFVTVADTIRTVPSNGSLLLVASCAL